MFTIFVGLNRQERNSLCNIAICTLIHLCLIFIYSSSKPAKYDSEGDHVLQDLNQTDMDHVYSNVSVDGTSEYLSFIHLY